MKPSNQKQQQKLVYLSIMEQQPSLCSVSFKLSDLIHNSLVKAPFYLPGICTPPQVKHSISARWLRTRPLSPLRRSRPSLHHSQPTLPPQKQIRGSPQTPLSVLCCGTADAQLGKSQPALLCNPTPPCHSSSVSAVSVP